MIHERIQPKKTNYRKGQQQHQQQKKFNRTQGQQMNDIYLIAQQMTIHSKNLNGPSNITKTKTKLIYNKIQPEKLMTTIEILVVVTVTMLLMMTMVKNKNSVNKNVRKRTVSGLYL